jgi:hypothetical protein
MSEKLTTILGVVGALVTVFLTTGEAFLPQEAKLVLGALNAALMFLLGKTHPGTKK